MKAEDHGKDGKGNNNHMVGESVRKPWKPNEGHGPKALGLLLFAVIGATTTTAAAIHLRRTFAWFYNQLNRTQSHSSWKTRDRGSTSWGFREDGQKRYNRRMQEEYEDEMERVERIRRVQSVFNRERNKFKRSYESWNEHGPGTYQHYQYAQRDDWYWKSDKSYKEQKYNARESSRDGGIYSMSHHYTVLGLDRSRGKPYSDVEIKTAFRAKALEFHPDQHQRNKEAAESKFKEVMASFEAIKLERKNGKT